MLAKLMSTVSAIYPNFKQHKVGSND